jgi:hypothetical protein
MSHALLVQLQAVSFNCHAWLLAIAFCTAAASPVAQAQKEVNKQVAAATKEVNKQTAAVSKEVQKGAKQAEKQVKQAQKQVQAAVAPAPAPVFKAPEPVKAWSANTSSKAAVKAGTASGTDVAAGVGLGVLPWLLAPVVAFGAIRPALTKVRCVSNAVLWLLVLCSLYFKSTLAMALQL